MGLGKDRFPRYDDLDMNGPRYLFPYVCFRCRKAFKRKFEEGLPDKRCPECAGTAVGLSRNFKAPATSDIQQWRKVAFLVENGFRFFHHYKRNGSLVAYPVTMAQAREFVAIYGRKH